MVKKAVLVLALAVLAAGGVFAQSLGGELNLGNFGAAAVSADSGFGFAAPLSGAFRQNSDFTLDLLADGTGGSSGGWMTESLFVAGLLNIPFGLWSWMNKDWLGAGITTGLYAIGITTMVVSNVGLVNEDNALIVMIGALVGLIGAPIYGYIRGSGQCETIQARNFANATGDNPLSHISLVALPTGKGNFGGVLTWSSSF
jgi:hypothetical protein